MISEPTSQNSRGEIMPEARDRLPGVGPVDMALGFGIRRRGFTVGARMRVLNPVRHDNQENIAPESSRSSSRRTRKNKSPLPSWYPRTPLRDITAVVNAMERRRRRLRDAAKLRRKSQEAANLASLATSNELSDSEDSPPRIQESPLSDLFPNPSAMTKKCLHPAEDLLASSPQENSASRDKDTVAADKKFSDSMNEICLAADKDFSNSSGGICVEDDKKFSDSVDEIERIVRENVQRMAKKTTKKSERSTLMSMR